ncbi:MAG: ribosome maturation factor RimM [Tannerellaceae bacterium]|jgi:16S rRNA processing protein RimM|nr:ribosome maturation factor RimM [Tannerellaceae bacterium]
MINKEDVCRIGYLTKPHGVKGEIGLVLSYDIFAQAGEPFLICEIEGILVPFFIETWRSKTDTVCLVKLELIDTEEAVREFSKREVYYPLRSMEGEAPDGGGGWWDFVGYTVSDETHGLLGELRAIDESTANTLLQIDYAGRELLIPAVEEWLISAVHENKELKLSLPPGLLEL